MNTHEISTRINLLVHVAPDDIIDEIACIQESLALTATADGNPYDHIEKAYPLLQALKEAMK
jgi:hypothetical protein